MGSARGEAVGQARHHVDVVCDELPDDDIELARAEGILAGSSQQCRRASLRHLAKHEGVVLLAPLAQDQHLFQVPLHLRPAPFSPPSPVRFSWRQASALQATDEALRAATFAETDILRQQDP